MIPGAVVEWVVFIVGAALASNLCPGRVHHDNLACVEVADGQSGNTASRGRALNQDGQSLSAVAKSNSDFSTELYTALTNSNGDNLIFSPFSLSSVMAMLKAGAQGQSAQDIQAALKFPSSDETLNQGYHRLLHSLQSESEKFTLETANKIYTKQGFEINLEFGDTIANFYDAEVKQLDFSKGVESAHEINTFVSRTTHDKIKDLISPDDLDPLTKLILVNAIYFKGSWKNKFNKDSTRQADFFLDSKQAIKVDTMRIMADFPYAEIRELNAKAVALPYQGDGLSMIILLPNEVNGLKEMETKLSTFNLAQLPNRLHEQTVVIKMPKFKLESTIDLKESLKQLGAGSIFELNLANFRGISNTVPLYVTKAVQKAFIEVNEEGSEAAAATGVVTGERSLPEFESVNANHPFAFYIFKYIAPATRNGEAVPPVPLFGGRFTGFRNGQPISTPSSASYNTRRRRP